MESDLFKQRTADSSNLCLNVSVCQTTAPRRIRALATTSRASEPQEQRARELQTGDKSLLSGQPAHPSLYYLTCKLRIMSGFMEVSSESGAQRQDVSFLKITVLHIRDGA